jgi:hypothetical protein
MLNATKIKRRSEQYHYKICLDHILIFLHQIKYTTDTENDMCKTFSVKDYSLEQFQKWVCKHIPKWDDRFTSSKKGTWIK